MTKIYPTTLLISWSVFVNTNKINRKYWFAKQNCRTLSMRRGTNSISKRYNDWLLFEREKSVLIRISYVKKIDDFWWKSRFLRFFVKMAMLHHLLVCKIDWKKKTNFHYDVNHQKNTFFAFQRKIPEKQLVSARLKKSLIFVGDFLRYTSSCSLFQSMCWRKGGRGAGRTVSGLLYANNISDGSEEQFFQRNWSEQYFQKGSHFHYSNIIWKWDVFHLRRP